MRRHPLLAAIVVVVVACALVAALGVLVNLPQTGPQAAPLAPSSPSSASTAAGADEADWPTPAPIAWHRCGADGPASGECAMVAVPRDWDSPKDGQLVHLAISRVEHTRSPYHGVMLVNPGGPGESGLDLSTIGARVPNGVGGEYDWIGFDPRGVGSSTPRLTCDAGYDDGPRPLLAPPTSSTITTWLQRSAAYAADCGKRNGALLDHMTTEDSAKDLEYLRLALGVQRISYFGFSYGTYLGQVYATLFPSRLDRLVLDSNVDPRTVWYRGNLDQESAFEPNVERFFTWVADNDAVYHLGSTKAVVEAHYAATAAALESSPADGEVGPDEFADVVLEAGYDAAEYPRVADAWTSLLAGDPQLLVEEWRITDTPGDDNVYAVYLAVQCTYAPWPTSFSTWRADADRLDTTASFETWPNTWFNMPCRTWPAKAGKPVQVDGSAAPPALLIDETLDAATPYEGSLEVRSRFPRSRLLAEPGGVSHAASLQGNACVDGTIARYLDTGALPARRPGRTADATCAPTPLPTAR